MKKIIYFIIIIILESCFGEPITRYGKIYFKNETLQNLNIKFIRRQDKNYFLNSEYVSFNLLSNTMDSIVLKEETKPGDPSKTFFYLQHKDNLDLDLSNGFIPALGIDSLEIKFNSNKKIRFSIRNSTYFELLQSIEKTDSFFYIKDAPYKEGFPLSNIEFAKYFTYCCFDPPIIILRPSLYDSAK